MSNAGKDPTTVSAYLKQVGDFVNYMQKEYKLDADDSERTLFFCATDSTLKEGTALKASSVGSKWQIADSLATISRDSDFQETMQLAIAMQERALELAERKRQLRKERRRVVALMAVSLLWLCVVVAQGVISFLLKKDTIAIITSGTNVLIMLWVLSGLWSRWKDIRIQDATVDTRATAAARFHHQKAMAMLRGFFASLRSNLSDRDE